MDKIHLTLPQKRKVNSSKLLKNNKKIKKILLKHNYYIFFLELKERKAKKEEGQSNSPIFVLGVKAKVKERKAKTRRRRAICKRINGTAAGTIQECGDLEETQEILAFLNVLSLSFFCLYLRLFYIFFILFSLGNPLCIRSPCFMVHGCCNDENLFTKQTLQIWSKLAKLVLHE